MVYCVSITDKTKKYPDELCDVSSRPINEKNCSSDVLCPPMWHASQWSKVRQDGVAAFTWASLCFDFPFIQLSEKMPKHVYCQSAGALTIWTENLVIPGRIQMVRFITRARLPRERKRKFYQHSLNPIFSVFSSKKYQYNISRQIFTVIFYQMLQIAAFNMQRLVNWGRRRRGERWQVFGQMTNTSVQMKASYVPLNSQVKSFIVNKIDMKFFCAVQNNFKLLETFSIMTLMVNDKPEDVMWPQWSRLQFAVHAWSFEALSFQR